MHEPVAGSVAREDMAPTLAEFADQPRRAMLAAANAGFRHVQLSAAQPGLRPRELDRSARRDVTVTLARLGLAAAGLDLWVPVAHWNDPGMVDRAASAVLDAIRLAADLGRLTLSLTLPDTESEPAMAVVNEAERHGVAIADHGVPPSSDQRVGVGIDPAAWLAGGEDPVAGLATHAERLQSVRLADLLTHGGRAPLGSADGRLDVPLYRRGVAATWFERPVVIDLRGWTDPLAGIEQTLAAWGEGVE